MGQVYIYGLLDPSNGCIRYVGATKNPEKRYNQHLYNPCNGTMRDWVAELKSAGIKPQYLLLDIVSAEDARFFEKEMIDTFRVAGFRTGYWLLNGGRSRLEQQEPSDPTVAYADYYSCGCGARFALPGSPEKDRIIVIANPVTPGANDIEVCPRCGTVGPFKKGAKRITWKEFWQVQ